MPSGSDGFGAPISSTSLIPSRRHIRRCFRSFHGAIHRSIGMSRVTCQKLTAVEPAPNPFSIFEIPIFALPVVVNGFGFSSSAWPRMSSCPLEAASQLGPSPLSRLCLPVSTSL